MPKSKIELSPEFKAQTVKAVASIALFGLTYLILFILAIGLTVLCVYGGVMLVLAIPKLATGVLGLGLASLGFLILIFLLKFIFKSHKVDRNHLHQITKAEEPGLFKLIEEIVNAVETSFPKKVYLSTEVNASVFYNSSFWSMFFPVRKNLQIGLGLVNSVSKSEFTAILSHEFGHFSQKTMKVGSYVYNVNQVIYNMIYENESYDRLIQKWANVSGYFSIFVVIAVKIIEGIQWVLRKLYEVVNKSYMGLSREMEFHADEIAASVTGYQPLKTSLLRLSLSDHAFDNVLSFYEGKITDNLKSENLYREHHFVMNLIANKSNLTSTNQLPDVTIEELNKFNKSKLVIKDQWASHPSTEERIERLEKSKFTLKQIENESASVVFTNIDETQRKLTAALFEQIDYQDHPATISFEEFQNQYQQEHLNNSFPKIYNGYYNHKNPIHFEVDSTTGAIERSELSALFSDEKVDLVYTTVALENDIETLNNIANKEISVKSFDYDGKKYRRQESHSLLAELKTELVSISEKIKQNDIQIFQFFQECEQNMTVEPELVNLYNGFFKFDKAFDAKYEMYTELSNELQFINYTTPFEQITSNFSRIKPLETKLKGEIKLLLEDRLFRSEITAEIESNFTLYLSKEWKYFGNEEYFEDNLGILFTAMNNYSNLLSKGYFLLKKELLNYQHTLIVGH